MIEAHPIIGVAIIGSFALTIGMGVLAWLLIRYFKHK